MGRQLSQEKTERQSKKTDSPRQPEEGQPGLLTESEASTGNGDLTAVDRYRFGERIVCDRCGIPRKPDAFNEGSVVCRHCVEILNRQADMTITPEDIRRGSIREKLELARKTSSPSVINGYDRAEEILGKSPQEVAAEMIVELTNPAASNPDLSPEQIAAIPRDYHTIKGFVDILQKAQFRRDDQLLGNDAIGDISSEDLRATILKGVLDSIDDDEELRLQVIRGFASRCETFFSEVAQVACEMGREIPIVSVKGGRDDRGE